MRTGVMSPGINKRLAQTAIYKRRAPDSLWGFFRTPKRRGVFRPLAEGPRKHSIR